MQVICTTRSSQPKGLQLLGQRGDKHLGVVFRGRNKGKEKGGLVRTKHGKIQVQGPGVCKQLQRISRVSGWVCVWVGVHIHARAPTCLSLQQLGTKAQGPAAPGCCCGVGQLPAVAKGPVKSICFLAQQPLVFCSQEGFFFLNTPHCIIHSALSRGCPLPVPPHTQCPFWGHQLLLRGCRKRRRVPGKENKGSTEGRGAPG